MSIFPSGRECELRASRWCPCLYITCHAAAVQCTRRRRRLILRAHLRLRGLAYLGFECDRIFFGGGLTRAFTGSASALPPPLVFARLALGASDAPGLAAASARLPGPEPKGERLAADLAPAAAAFWFGRVRPAPPDSASLVSISTRCSARRFLRGMPAYLSFGFAFFGGSSALLSPPLLFFDPLASASAACPAVRGAASFAAARCFSVWNHVRAGRE
mmetsp:Transcript_21913/g.55940  ORF Transcript_21913/g.55940 Transcript_21913/m.55940 type:complete len:217 (-) Transcript_21913:82-732(-)